ncbi:MAG TPA: cation:proton antiporter [Longimicrobiales bacterium]|nr:cation:proton antiporter [Longimicrobiales bacterium]
MEPIALLLFAAAIAYGVAHLLHVPSIPVLLLTGVALTLTQPLPPTLVQDTLVLGTTLLLFATGIELNPRRSRAQRTAAGRVGTIQFLLLGAVGLLAAVALGYEALPAMYIALALTASSTLVVVRLLQRRRQMFEPFGRLVLGVLLLQDVLVLLLVPVVTDLPDGLLPVITGVGATLALVGLAWATFRWVAPLIQRLDREDEVILLVLLAVLFVFIGLADLLDLPLVTGAFLAGIGLSRFPLNGMVRAHLGSIAEFFSALFFIALGALIGIPTGLELFHAIILAAVVVVVTAPLVTVIAERAGMSSRASIEAGLLLTQTSEISLVIGLFGLIGEQITRSVFIVIALVTLFTMLLTPFIANDAVAWWLMRRRRVRAIPQRRSLDRMTPTAGHVLILGSGATGMPLLETVLGMGHDVLVIDDDPVVIQRLREADIPCLRGDASDIALLKRASANKARIITSTIRRPQDNRRLLEFARGVPALIRVFEESDAKWISELGGTPVLASHAAGAEMLKWFDQEFERGPGGAGAPAAGASVEGSRSG